MGDDGRLRIGIALCFVLVACSNGSGKDHSDDATGSGGTTAPQMTGGSGGDTSGSDGAGGSGGAAAASADAGGMNIGMQPARDGGDGTDASSIGHANDGGAAIHDPDPGACTSASDYEGDGIANFVFVYEYDAQDRQERISTDYEGDGKLDATRTVTYAASGEVEQVEVDRDLDGDVDDIYAHTFTASGKPLRDIDSTADGEVTRTRDYLYDDDEFLIAIVENLQPNGKGMTRSTYENDDKGCMIASDQDDGDDGKIDFHSTYKVDAECRWLERKMDEGADGTLDWIETQTFDDQGRNLSRRVTLADGTIDVDSTWEYDGERLLRQADFRNRGISSITTYTYDAAGNLLLVEERADETGELVSSTRYELDERGNPLRVLRDEDGDGTADDITTNTYDCWR